MRTTISNCCDVSYFKGEGGSSGENGAPGPMVSRSVSLHNTVSFSSCTEQQQPLQCNAFHSMSHSKCMKCCEKNIDEKSCDFIVCLPSETLSLTRPPLSVSDHRDPVVCPAREGVPEQPDLL